MYALGSAHGKFEVWNKVARAQSKFPCGPLGRPKLDVSKLIDSNVDLFMYLIERIRFVAWISNDYFESLLLPHLLRVEND